MVPDTDDGFWICDECADSGDLSCLPRFEKGEKGIDGMYIFNGADLEKVANIVCKNILLVVTIN